ncbi:hypothetical protein, partial [Bacillus haynesii]
LIEVRGLVQSKILSNGDPDSIGVELVYTWLFGGMYNLESAKNETSPKTSKFIIMKRYSC